MFQSVCKYLDLEFSERIKSISPLKLIVNDMVVAYEGQVPNVAVWVNHGDIVLKNKLAQNKSMIQSGPVLVFLDQVINEQVSSVSIEIKKGAEVSILDRPTLKKLSLLK